MRYELLERTADVMVRARGKDLEECFANAAYALFDQMVDVSKVEATTEVGLQMGKVGRDAPATALPLGPVESE